MCKLCTILRIAAKNTLIFSVAAIFIAIFTGFKGIVSNENMLKIISRTQWSRKATKLLSRFFIIAKN